MYERLSFVHGASLIKNIDKSIKKIDYYFDYLNIRIRKKYCAIYTEGKHD